MDKDKLVASLRRGGYIALGATALVGGILVSGTYQMGRDVWAGLKSLKKEIRSEAVG